ncbi:unnamed protein product [Microthlaspi erraticum]|uniref:Zinc knuckle CX2CX4HX4C domain-containing protein n=1 Tax=Microthlaspi erraticum TaxID=1685480 RepID=A0A6D2K5A1_9BRAS|nr:unnamed protein product [Microthlaspi erraticum]
MFHREGRNMEVALGMLTKPKIWDVEGRRRYCFTCKHLSHEEGTCPCLSEEHKEINKALRLEQNLATQEFSPTYSRSRYEAPPVQRYPSNKRGGKIVNYKGHRDQGSSSTLVHGNSYSWERKLDQSKEKAAKESDTRQRDLRQKLSDQRHSRRKDIWNRMERNRSGRNYGPQDRYHPYRRARDEPIGNISTRHVIHKMWRPRQNQDSRALRAEIRMETPNSRVTHQNQNDAGTPVDSQRMMRSQVLPNS